MKNIRYIILGIFALALTFFACTKEADITFSFPFDLTKSHEEIATINYKEPTFIRIVPEQIVTDNVYQFTYIVTDGEGYLRYAGQDQLMENTPHTCESFELDFEFIGTEIGIVKIALTVTDLDDRIETIELLYNVVHNPFEWEANATSTDVTINQLTPLTLLLNNTGEDESVTYVSNITFLQGAGTLFYTDDNGSSTLEIEQGISYEIEEGAHLYNLTLDQTGITIINFEGTDSNGQSIDNTLTYNVGLIDYTYTGASQNNTLYVGQTTNINQEINEILGSGDNYNVRYEFVNGSGSLSRQFNGSSETLLPGVNYSVEANAFYWEFEATEIGNTEIQFFAINDSGVEREIKIIINVLNGAFQFSAIPTQNFGSVNGAIAINFDINELGPSGAPYTMIYQSTSNGQFVYNGITYLPGEVINFRPLNFSGEYTGLAQGNHDIIFTVTNNFADSVTDDMTLLFNKDAFVFTAAAEQQNITVSNSVDFNFNITDSDSGATYQIYYTVSGTGNGVLSNGGNIYDAGVLYNVLPNAFSWDFEAVSVGSLTYTFIVENNSGVQQSQVINVNIDSAPACQFNFTAIPAENSSFVGDQVAINFNVNTTVGGTNYELIFTTSESGTLSYNGVVYSPGQVIPLGASPNSFVANYAGTNAASHSLDFTITCDGGTNETESASIDFENIDFNLTSSGDTSLYINTIEDFNLFLSQTTTDPTITYNVVFSLGSGTVGNGNITASDNSPIVLGTSYPIILGSAGFNFEGTAVGLVNIVASVTDSNNVMHDTTIAMQIEDISYTFTAAPQNNTVGSGGSTPINMSIDEDLFSGADYEVKYVVTSGSATVTNNGTVLNTNTYYQTTIGNFAWTFQAQNPGTVELLFTAKNTTTNEEQTQAVTINIDSAPACQFNFTAIPAENSSFVGDQVAINFNVNTTVGGTNYELIFTTSESGTLSYNGVVYSPGQVISLGSNPGAFVANYSATNDGPHELAFSINCDSGTTESQNTSIIFTNTDFSLSTVGDGTLFLNTVKDFFTIITQNTSDASVNYNVTFSIESGSTGNGEVYLNNNLVALGIPQAISLGNTAFEFLGTISGEVTLLVSVTDSNNNTHTSTIDFAIEDVNFNFTATPQDGSIILGENTNVYFNISESANSGTNYNIRYVITSSETGEFINGGNVVNPNTNTPISIGSSSWVFNSIEEGNIQISFTVANNVTLEEKTDNININVIPESVSDFNFSAIPVSNSSEINECITINFNLTEINGSSGPYSMHFTSSNNGTFLYNGVTYLQGEVIPFDLSISNGCYTGIDDGTHNVEFTVSNNNSPTISHSDDFDIQFLAPNFSFSAIPQSNEADINDNVDVNFMITEVNGSGAPYSLLFNSDSSGLFTYNGITYNSGETITDINNLSFIGQYTGISIGENNITFTLTNSSIPSVSENENFNITFNPIVNNDVIITEAPNRLEHKVQPPRPQNSYYFNSPDDFGYMYISRGAVKSYFKATSENPNDLFFSFNFTYGSTVRPPEVFLLRENIDTPINQFKVLPNQLVLMEKDVDYVIYIYSDNRSTVGFQEGNVDFEFRVTNNIEQEFMSLTVKRGNDVPH